MLNTSTQSPHERDDVMSSARHIAARLGARAAQADSDCRIPDATIAEMKAVNLFRLLQPRRWGGREADPQLFIDVQNTLAEHCLSTAWVFGVLSVQSFMLSLFDMRAQQDVWGTDGSALMSSSFQPVGKAQRVEGGFQVSGQWPYSSGCQHAQWAVLGALVPSELAEGAPEMRLFLVPRTDYEIVDTWNTFGLRGTGSHDIRVEHAFIPEYRTLKPEQGLTPGSTLSVHGVPLYRMPWLYMFTCTVAGLGIGGARGALNVFLDAAHARLSTPAGKARMDTGVLQAAAHTKNAIDDIDATLRRNTARLMECARTGETMAMAEALQLRLHLTAIVRRCADLVENLMPYLGARAVFLDNPFTRFWLDLSAARVHPGNDPSSVGADLGKLLIGDAAS